MMYPIIPDGIFLIKHAEGLRLKAYQDSGGIYTIGYGHTLGVSKDQTTTEAGAEIFLVSDLLDSLKDIANYVKVELTAHQKAAVASFVFNLGGTKFKNSTLCKLLNQSRFDLAVMQFGRWIYGKDGKGVTITFPGLVKRRKAEAKLFQGIPWGEIIKTWDEI